MSIYGKSIFVNEGILGGAFQAAIKRLFKKKDKNKKHASEEPKYFYFVSQKEESTVPNNYKGIDSDYKPKSEKDALKMFLYGYAFNGESSSISIQTNSDIIIPIPGYSFKTDITVYVYRFNKSEFDLVKTSILKDLIDKHFTIGKVDMSQYNERKQVVSQCISASKQISKKYKYAVPFDIESYDGCEDDQNDFYIGASNSIGIISCDLWDFNPNARTNGDLNEQIYADFDNMNKEVKDKVLSKYNGKYDIEFGGDWDSIFYELIAKK